MTQRGLVRCSLAAVLFGLSAPAASRLAGDMGAFSLAGLLYLGAALFVLPVTGRHRPGRTAVRRSLPRLAVAVVVGGAIGPVLLATGLQHTPPATASLLLNLELVFTTVLAFSLFHEHLGRPVIAGTVLVVIAGIVVGWSGEPDLRWGVLAIAGACLCWGVDNGVTAALDELTPSQITLVKGVAAGTTNLTIGLALGNGPTGWAVLGALVVGGLGYGASITLWVAGARDLGAARGQLVFATAPFVGAAASWTLFAEPVKTAEVVALVIAAAGVSVVLRSAHEHQHHHAAMEHDHEHTHDDGYDAHQHEPLDPNPRHQHRHRHEPTSHSHPHVPDLHHRHEHAT